MKRIKQLALLSVVIAVAALVLLASNKHDRHKPGSTHPVPGMALTEGGQSTFAALIELVDRLEQDPDTDWPQVNIDRLHQHLVQMNLLMLQTRAETRLTPTSIQFDIVPREKPQRDVTDAIQAMATAHSAFIAQSRGWTIETLPTESGATITISTDNQTLRQKLMALGFYGFMSLDSHHQAHHFQMATGGSHQTH